MRIIKALVAAAALVALAGCTTDADRVNENLNTDAEQFNIERTIVFYNGITGEHIAAMVGKCSIERDELKMQAICKVGPNEFSRDEIGLSDNVTYFALQNKPVAENVYRKKIVLKPGNALPDFDVETGPQGGQTPAPTPTR